jgi:hypothetical protein
MHTRQPLQHGARVSKSATVVCTETKSAKEVSDFHCKHLQRSPIEDDIETQSDDNPKVRHSFAEAEKERCVVCVSSSGQSYWISVLLLASPVPFHPFQASTVHNIFDIN